MSTKFMKFSKLLILVLILCITFAGCGLFRPSAPKSKDTQQKKEPPKSLTQMEEATDSMIKSLQDVQKKRAKQQREQMQPSKSEEPKKEQGQGQGQSQGQSQGSQGQSQGQSPSPPPPPPSPPPLPEPNWAKLETTAESLHVKWNSFEPLARSEDASTETIDSFEKQLIVLTEQIMARNEENTLIAANKLYSHYPIFLKLFMHKQPPEVKEAKYLARQIVMYGQQDKWDESKTMLGDMKKAWQNAKTSMTKSDKNLNKRIDAAIIDFSYVVGEKKKNLTQLKGDILINNLDQIK